MDSDYIRAYTVHIAFLIWHTEDDKLLPLTRALDKVRTASRADKQERQKLMDEVKDILDSIYRK